MRQGRCGAVLLKKVQLRTLARKSLGLIQAEWKVDRLARAVTDIF
jgi:hypothetical protein